MAKVDNVFNDWLIENTNISHVSVEHYERGVRAVSSDMLAAGVIDRPLSEMSVSELEIALEKIFADAAFIEKNSTGRRMYSNALKHFRAYKLSDIQATEAQVARDIAKIENDRSLSITERTALTKSRVGQGAFRAKLLEKYSSRCVVTGISDKRLLHASHIRPWSVSDNADRLDVDNGLLLSALYDNMFDIGLISFTDEGMLIVSRSLSNNDRLKIGVDTLRQYDLIISDRMKANLTYHRDVIFIG